MDSNEAIAIQIAGEHEPKIRYVADHNPHYTEPFIACSAKDCEWRSTDSMPWGQHVAEAINDHLGLWGPEDEEEELAS